jgi:hypothetical protein
MARSVRKTVKEVPLAEVKDDFAMRSKSVRPPMDCRALQGHSNAHHFHVPR